MDPRPPVFVITGQLAAGKSTIARALLDRYPLGFHVDLDGIREMVTSGLASPLHRTEETTRQFELAMRAAAGLAHIYAGSGFAVAIEGGIDPGLVEVELTDVGLVDRMFGVTLRPRLDVALERNRTRGTKGFDTSILEPAMRRIDADLVGDPDGVAWHVVDNSDESVAETVDRILALQPQSHR